MALHESSHEELSMADLLNTIVMEEVTDLEELAKARAQDERFERNFRWFQEHAAEIFTRYRGQCIYIAGEELFAADTPEEVIAQANAAHPEDNGGFVHCIPKEKVAHIYAHRWRMGAL
jgi:hypothetical protein